MTLIGWPPFVVCATLDVELMASSYSLLGPLGRVSTHTMPHPGRASRIQPPQGNSIVVHFTVDIPDDVSEVAA